MVNMKIVKVKQATSAANLQLVLQANIDSAGKVRILADIKYI